MKPNDENLKKELLKIMKIQSIFGLGLISFTNPSVILYFYGFLNPQLLALSNTIALFVDTMSAKITTNKEILKKLDKYFIHIITLDLILFLIASFTGYQYPITRYFIIILSDNITTSFVVSILIYRNNKCFYGDTLTELQTKKEYYRKFGLLIGSIFASIVTMSLESALIVQAIAVTVIAITASMIWKKLK